MIFDKFVPAPDHAEQLILHEFMSVIPGKKSRYVADLVLPSKREMICPACKTKQGKEPQHGEHTGCIKCDLKWVVFGNCLNIWKDRHLKLVR